MLRNIHKNIRSISLQGHMYTPVKRGKTTRVTECTKNTFVSFVVRSALRFDDALTYHDWLER